MAELREISGSAVPLPHQQKWGRAGAQATLLGLVLTQVDRRPKVTGEVIDLIRGHYGDRVFKTEIPINVRLSEAPSFGRTIFGHDPSSSGADAYRRLAAEVLQKCRRDGKK
ncbi:MAG: ParA family protein [Deltaproteobacteria bacterium]|nr:ParA family protein [Deltaproteobacteria bacterium]MBP6830240.1 ParA family protein [Deltaproteobacteria bacterium]